MPDIILGGFSTDVTPPEVTAWAPTGTGVARAANVVFDIWDEETGVDTDSLNVTVGGLDAVIAGVIQLADFTGSITDMGSGTWRVTLNPNVDFPNYDDVEVKVNAQDLAPSPNIMDEFAWSFETEDDVAPSIYNNAPTGVDVSVGVYIQFWVVDDGSGVDLVNTIVTVNGTTVYDDGFQSGWENDSYITPLTAPPATFPGFAFEIKKNVDLDEWTDHETIVTTQDVAGNPTIFDWTFKTLDATAPAITNNAPTGTGIVRDSDVEFDITDTMSGVDTATLDVTVDGLDAIIDGVFQTGFTGSILDMGGGTWHVTIDPDDIFPNYAPVLVNIDVEDVSGNPVNFFWSFTTEDDVAPVVSANTPTGTNVPTSTNIAFDITDDGMGIASSAITVTINGDTALVAGVFQSPYDGPGSAITTIAGGRHVVIDPSADLDAFEVYTVDVDAQDLAGNVMTTFSWFFQTSDVIGPVLTNNVPTGVDVVIESLVEFDITDIGAGIDLTTLVVTIGGVSAYDGGAGGFQVGFLGLGSAITPIANGYHVAIDKDPDYAGWTTYWVFVDVSDLATPPNPMTTFSWSFRTENTDPDAPTIFDVFPGDGVIDVELDTNIGFSVIDATGVDVATLQMTLNGAQVIIDGVQASGFVVTMTGVPTLMDVVIDPVSNLLLDTDYTVIVNVADIVGNSGSRTWVFTTLVGVIVSPVLTAVGYDQLIKLSWVVPPPEAMLQETFELRRSTVAYPVLPTEGKLVYQGAALVFDDENVINGVTYYYTIFVVRRHVAGVPEYVPYEPQASAEARPRAVVVAPVKIVEYVPTRGEFGPKTVNPLPQGQTVAIWGPGRRQSDLVRTTAGKPFQSPVRGSVRALRDVTDFKVIEIETASGIVLVLSGVRLLSSVVVGMAVEAGQAIGRTVDGVVEFEIYKLPVANFGRRTIRPRYFYLTVEERDGRL